MKHHPDPATLLEYASGTLSTPFSILVSAHIETCDESKKIVKIGEEIGGDYIDNIEPNEEQTIDYSAFLKKLDSNELKNTNKKHKYNYDLKSVIPSVLQPYIGQNFNNIDWSFLAFGIKKYQVNIDNDPSNSLTLLKIKPKKKIPAHGHTGREMTLVLQGSFDDEHGSYAAGDIAEHDGVETHQPIVSSDEDCICIISTEGPLIFNNYLANKLQSLIRI